jgi:hypothetical protein
MKYLIIIASIMWGVFFYTNAKAHNIEEIQKQETQVLLNDMTLDIISIILENLPIILQSIENDLLKEKGKRIPCWKRIPRDYDCIPEMTPMTGEVEKNE